MGHAVISSNGVPHLYYNFYHLPPFDASGLRSPTPGKSSFRKWEPCPVVFISSVGLVFNVGVHSRHVQFLVLLLRRLRTFSLFLRKEKVISVFVVKS